MLVFRIYIIKIAMKRTFEEALANRRSYYSLGNDSPVAHEEIVRILHEAVRYVPSAYNSQTTRIVLLLHDEHLRLWRFGALSVKPSCAPRERIFLSWITATPLL